MRFIVPWVTWMLPTFLTAHLTCAAAFASRRRVRFHSLGCSIPTNACRKQVIMSSSNNNGVALLEVEQKFALTNINGDVKEKLLELGLERQGETKKMVDWYFDLPAPRWILTPQDYWLRFRETERASGWQLKRGLRRHEEGGATVYEEIEGDDAVRTALSMLPKNNDSSINSITTFEEITPPVEYEGHAVPELSEPSCGLVPFARIETHRSSWAVPDDIADSSPFGGLMVDLDGTNFGYMVGEVEAVVDNEQDVADARQKIAALVSKLLPDKKSDPAVGKLEYYLIRNRRDHYDACVQGGSIQDKSKTMDEI